jgi:hypothetical protein
MGKPLRPVAFTQPTKNGTTPRPLDTPRLRVMHRVNHDLVRLLRASLIFS